MATLPSIWLHRFFTLIVPEEPGGSPVMSATSASLFIFRPLSSKYLQSSAKYFFQRTLISSRHRIDQFLGPPHQLLLRNGATLRSASRSEEHTSELQSLRHLVCPLL